MLTLLYKYDIINCYISKYADDFMKISSVFLSEVSTMLSEQEWNTLNNILLELYTTDSIDNLFSKLIKLLRMLILFTKSYFLLLDDEQCIINDETYFSGMDKETVQDYINHYYNEDYLSYIYEITAETTVYKDTNILIDDIRKHTEFYKNFLKPLDIPYGCGIMIIKNKRIIGIFNLFRSEKLNDFSDRDIYILDILKKHIENIVYNTIQLSRQHIVMERCFTDISEEYSLTKREMEIFKLLSKGLSNTEICDELFISLSTVKKHIYNLYLKTGVNSRTQLINLLYNGSAK